ncbi:MAG: hydantoinase B/oxoprolinase family protein [Hyphomicrobium sp.]|nr:hydantoinase B/oxoprolinase family protein [Hyphomicrobium sp.]
MQEKLDSIDAGIIWSRFVSIADEMVSALVRTSFSTMVRESGDYSCMLFDAKGRFLSQGTASVPSFTGTGPATLSGMLAHIPADTLADGDVLLTNDPWIGTGHVYDVNIVKPIFRNGRLVAYALSVSHLADIGGIGYGTGARDNYEEGICIPPVKLFVRGEPNKFVFDLIEANVRFRDLVIGDIYSNVAACNVAAAAIDDLLAEYGLADTVAAADAIFELTHHAISDVLRTLPCGEFAGSLSVEGVEDDALINLAVRISVSPEGFAFDFRGTSPVVNRGINVPLCYTRAYCYFTFKTIVASNIPNNQAVLDFVTIAAPDNCILNAKRPYATGGRHILGHYVAPLVFGALADAVPMQVQADSGMICQINFRGRSHQGRDYSYILFTSGGYGAFADLDGRPVLPGPSNMIGIPVEIWEENTGISFLRKEWRIDSSGAGAFQGGAGQVVELRNDTGAPVDAAFFASRTSRPARGFAGGIDGSLRVLSLDGGAVAPKSRRDVAPGSVIVLEEAGGGGFGPPERRTLDRIRADLDSGLTSLEYVRNHYPEQARALEAEATTVDRR